MTWSLKRGFTLLESLITVLLVMLVFGLLAELLIGAFQISRFERQKSEASEASQLALNRIICEVREACKVVIPGTYQEITLTKFNTSKTSALTLELDRFKYLLEVRYFLDSAGTLLRDVRDLDSGTLDTYVIADGLQGARFEFINGDIHENVKVTLSVNVRDPANPTSHVRSISSEVAPQAYLP